MRFFVSQLSDTPGSRTMATFEYLFHFGTEEGEEYFTKCNSTNPDIGTLVNSFFTLEDLLGDKNPKQATVAKV